VLNGGAATPVSIHVGISDGTFVEVVDGPLKEGDAVITEQIGEDTKPATGGGGGGPGRRGY
jgi:hypothetical protein